MQVKKFEARTMKEALEMVKTQMGPDAIILSARDNHRSFGLVGQGSVEITAAVSEETLHKKKFTESRLRPEDKNKLLNSSAKTQKQVINSMVNKYVQEKKTSEVQSAKANQMGTVTKARYIDIPDENVYSGSSITNVVAERAWSSESYSRVKENEVIGDTKRPNQFNESAQSDKVSDLRNEIATLKQVIAQFSQVPQSLIGSRHPGADYGLCFEVSAMFQKLVDSGLAQELAAELMMQAQDEMPALKLKSKALVEAWTAKSILKNTEIVADKDDKKFQVFVGPAGSGKTSSVIKLASHYVVKENKKVALVTTDTMKVGATDQMRIYAQILNVPFAVVRKKTDWEKIYSQLSQYDHVLIDYAGLSLKSMEEISEIRHLMPPQDWNCQVHLVLSCLAKDTDLVEMGKRYQVTGYHDVIFNALDESTQHGNIYGFMKRYSVPLHSFGLGPRVPEDYEKATKERVLDLIFRISKLSSAS